MFTIRPFEKTDADYAMMTAIDTAVFAEFPRTVEEWRHIDASRSRDYLFCREMIEWNGEVIAFGEYGQLQFSFHPQKYNFFVLVHPEHEHPDARQIYFDHVMKILAPYNPIAITSGMLEDKKTHIDFLLQQGFRETMRESISRLDLATFDATKFAGIPEKVRAAGIRIVTAAELRESDPNWQRELWELDWQLLQDVPSPNPPQKLALEEFIKRRFDDPGFMPEGYWVALDGNRYVGQTSLWISEARKNCCLTGLTGVARSHRRKGIATALKLRAIDFARQRGSQFVETGNEDNNPMYRINLALGFRPQAAWVDFEKVLRADADAP